MSTIAKAKFNQIIDDPTIGYWEIKELIDYLLDYFEEMHKED